MIIQIRSEVEDARCNHNSRTVRLPSTDRRDPAVIAILPLHYKEFTFHLAYKIVDGKIIPTVFCPFYYYSTQYTYTMLPYCTYTVLYCVVLYMQQQKQLPKVL